jgi:hypothetical protein
MSAKTLMLVNKAIKNLLSGSSDFPEASADDLEYSFYRSTDFVTPAAWGVSSPTATFTTPASKTPQFWNAAYLQSLVQISSTSGSFTALGSGANVALAPDFNSGFMDHYQVQQIGGPMIDQNTKYSAQINFVRSLLERTDEWVSSQQGQTDAFILDAPGQDQAGTTSITLAPYSATSTSTFTGLGFSGASLTNTAAALTNATPGVMTISNGGVAATAVVADGTVTTTTVVNKANNASGYAARQALTDAGLIWNQVTPLSTMTDIGNVDFPLMGVGIVLTIYNETTQITNMIQNNTGSPVYLWIADRELAVPSLKASSRIWQFISSKLRGEVPRMIPCKKRAVAPQTTIPSGTTVYTQQLNIPSGTADIVVQFIPSAYIGVGTANIMVSKLALPSNTNISLNNNPILSCYLDLGGGNLVPSVYYGAQRSDAMRQYRAFLELARKADYDGPAVPITYQQFYNNYFLLCFHIPSDCRSGGQITFNLTVNTAFSANTTPYFHYIKDAMLKMVITNGVTDIKQGLE